MAELPLDQAVPRFKANEDRLDTFVNSATGYTTSGGTSVQSIQQFLASIGSNGIDFVDNAKARFGTGNDLEIYHSGSGSFIRDTGTGDLTIDGSAISIQTASAERISVSASGIDVTGTVEFDGLSGTGSVTITDIADEDNMASNSATKLATQQSIKAYVDAQVGTADTLSEVLGLGNTTGGTDIAVSANDDITFTDSSKAIFGAGSDLQIYHDASNSYIKEAGTGNLFIDATSLRLRTGAGTETYLTADGNGSVSLYNNNVKKLETTASGIDVVGVTTTTNGYQFGTQDSYLYQSTTDQVNLRVGDTGSYRYFQFTDTSSGSRIGTASGALSLGIASNDYLNIATSGNVSIPSGNLDVTGTVEFNGLSGTGSVTVTDILDEDDMTSDSATALATQQSIKAYVDANAGGGGGLPTTGGTMTGDILFNDGVKAKYGTSSDLQIFHDGSNSYITDSGTGVLFLRTNQLQIQSDDGLETYGVFTDNGAVNLYHNNSEKLATTSNGIQVTNVTDISMDGSASGQFKVQGSGYGFGIALDADAANIYTNSSSRDLVFGVNETEVARVKPAGLDVTGVTKTSGSGYNPANTGWATNASLITSGSYGGGLTFLDGSAGYSIRVENSGADLVIGQGATSGALTQKVKIDATGIDVTGSIDVSGGISINSFAPTLTFNDLSATSDYEIAVDQAKMQIKAGTATKLEINTSGIDVTGNIDVATSGASNTSNGLAIATSGTNFESDGGIISIDHAASGAVTGGYFSKYSAGGTLRHSIKGDGKGYFAGGIDVSGATNTTGTSGTRQWSAGSAGQKLGIYAYDNSTFYHRLETGNATNYQWGVYDNIPIYTITNNSIKTTLLGNGNFGVGHTSPVAKMAILGTSVSTITEANSNLCVEGSGGNGMLFGTLSTTGFKSYIQSGYVSSLGTATYDLLLNPEGGNVSIGTSAPSYKLDVRGEANSDVAIQVKASGTGDVDAELRLDAADTGEALVRYARDGTTRAISEYTNSNEWNFTTYNQDVIDFQPNSTHVMRIKHNGNVGIGNTTCADKLHVEGNVYLGSSSRSVYTGGGGDLRLQTNTGEVKVLTANGATTNLITSGTGIDIPTSLDVGTTLNVGNATPAGSGTIESHVQSSSTPALITYSGSSSLRTHISFENANGQVGKINTTGTQTFYVTSSDYRLKTDIQPMQGSIDRVKALKPVNFEWTGDGTRVDGFIAHEAQEVVPEAIVGDKDAMQDQQYVESKATGDIFTPAVEATYETIQVELTPAVDAVYETVTVEISPAVEATYDEDGNELTPAVEAVTEEQEQLVTPAVDATYEEQQQELTPAIDEVIHSSDVVEPDTLEEGQLWRETTEKVMATRQVPDYQGIDQSKIVPLLTSALQDAIAKIEALETRLEALEA